MKKRRLLTRAEEDALGRTVHDPALTPEERRAARDTLVLRNQGLVRWVARRYWHLVDLDELCQAGNIGLIDAAERWVPGQGTKFGTFARHYIKRDVMECIHDRTMIRTPRYFSRPLKHVLREDFKRPVSAARRRCNLEAALRARLQHVSMSAVDADTAELVCPRSPDPTVQHQEADEMAQIREILARLALVSPRVGHIIKRRLGLEGEPRPWRVIGKELGVTGQTAINLYKEGLRYIRRALGEAA